MSLNPTWDRRTFLTALGLSGAAAALPAAAAIPAVSPPATTKAPPTYVFASFAHYEMVSSGGILTYEVRDGIWLDHRAKFGSLPAEGLLAHPGLPVLYIATLARADDRRGSVIAVTIDPRDGISLDHYLSTSRHWLNRLNRQPLALATTWPRHMALSPDARSLLVADWLGRHYNILPLAADGSILPVEHVLKHVAPVVENGVGPHSVVFHPRGHAAYATDLAADTLHFISLEKEQPAITHGVSFAGKSGPSHLALASGATRLVVAHHSRASLSVVPLDPETGSLGTPLGQHTLASHGIAGALAISPAGDRVYATTSHLARVGRQSLTVLHTLRLSGSGRLTALARTPLPHLSGANQLTFLGPDLLVVGEGGIVTVPLSPRSGSPLEPSLSVCSGNLTGVILRPV